MPREKTWHEAINESLDQSDGSVSIGMARVHVVRSNSEPGEYHYVLQFGVSFESLVCTGGSRPCRAFKFHDDCRHIRRVRRENS